jgi:FtsH-binding integral membrane protein
MSTLPSYSPPTYSSPPATKSNYGSAQSEPLLGNQQEYASGSNAPSNEWGTQGVDDDPEDFKIGMTVSQSSADVRAAFIRKVYSILLIQIVSTVVIGALMRLDAPKAFVQANPGFMFIPMFGAMGAMFAVYWKRHSHPLNLILLATFTLLEATTIGSVVGFYDSVVVLQALVITIFVFLGLTLFTLQSKYDFSSMAPYLFGGILVFLMTTIVGIFLPYNRTMDMLMAAGGTLLFSAFIIYDTHLLMNRLHIDDWILATVSLYLDVVNLFLQILRLLNSSQDN